MHGLDAAIRPSRALSHTWVTVLMQQQRCGLLGDDVVTGTITVLRLSSREIGQFVIHSVLLQPQKIMLQPESCPDTYHMCIT